MINIDIINYIKIQRQKGFDDENIRQALISVGWRLADIEDAFNAASFGAPIVPMFSSGQYNNQVNYQTSDEQDIRENKMWALLGYFGIFALIPLLVKSNSKFAQFHAKQGLVLVVSEVVFFMLNWVLIAITIFSGGAGIFFLIFIVMGVIILFFMAIWVIAVIKVLQGQYWRIPVIGKFANK